MGALQVRLKSIKDLRLERMFRTTVHQKYDFSCGSAAIATLLTHHYSRTVNEAQVFQAMYERGDKAKIQREGFSLLDMKRYLESLGYQADGFEVGLEKVEEAKTPAIVLVSENGYNHFVVIKGIRDDKILVGDPALGTRTMSKNDFYRIWQRRIVFVIRSHTQMARFNDPQHWRVQLPAPVGTEVVNLFGLSNPTMMMRGPNDF
jgi:predicted double-glycine peptidase